MSTSNNKEEASRERILYNELFNYPSIEFKNHLQLKDNHRILFSGMYGVGKTTFINHFFDARTQEGVLGAEKYKVIHLYPVNYSISTTEDIFRYIKIDILMELMTKYKNEITFTIDKLSASTVASFYLAEKFNHVAGPLLMLFGQLNSSAFPDKEVLTAYNTLKSLYDKATTEIDKLVDYSDNLKQIASFIKPEIEREGSPYEHNLVTNLIIDFTKQLREDDKEVILIIDDLDRLDPNHIFRLFNIFAAHFDQRLEAQNKFGFDKVMFVCDVDNIKRLYAHFYGGSASFSGYIDKFYSRRIFRYDNVDSLREMVKTLVQDCNIHYEYAHRPYKLDNPLAHHNLTNILTTFLVNGSVNLRSLLKLSLPIKLRYKDLELGLPYDNMNIKIPAAVELEVLVDILGGNEEVMDAFLVAKEYFSLAPEDTLYNPTYRNFVCSCLPIVGFGDDRYRRYELDGNRLLRMELLPNNIGGQISVVTNNEEILEVQRSPVGKDAADFYIEALNVLIKRRFL